MKMKIMIAFGIPPSGKKAQVLRRTLMPDGNEAELIEKYAEDGADTDTRSRKPPLFLLLLCYGSRRGCPRRHGLL